MPVTDTFSEFKLSFDIVVPDTAAIILAAGGSTRMGGVSKQFLALDGIPVIMRSVLAFENTEEIKSIVIVAKADDIIPLQALCNEYNITKLADIIEGGETRAISSKNGVERCKDAEFVAIHDGARPLVSAEVIRAAIDGAKEHGAALPGVPLKDTVKRVDADGKVLETPERGGLMAVQTPQVFKTELYKESLSKLGEEAEALTDDAAVLEQAGYSVYITQGDYKNIKITTPEDIKTALSFLEDLT